MLLVIYLDNILRTFLEIMNSAKLCRLCLVALTYLRQSIIVYKSDKYIINPYSKN